MEFNIVERYNTAVVYATETLISCYEKHIEVCQKLYEKGKITIEKYELETNRCRKRKEELEKELRKTFPGYYKATRGK